MQLRFLRRQNSYMQGLRGLLALGNAGYDSIAGSCCLNGNNAPSDANVNIGASLRYYYRSAPLPMEKHIER
ncbi:MAG: hypothetical protein E7104_00605 [Prevotella sp.]|nr:hypothetical protein [Prevotella sp.]